MQSIEIKMILVNILRYKLVNSATVRVVFLWEFMT